MEVARASAGDRGKWLGPSAAANRSLFAAKMRLGMKFPPGAAGRNVSSISSAEISQQTIFCAESRKVLDPGRDELQRAPILAGRVEQLFVQEPSAVELPPDHFLKAGVAADITEVLVNERLHAGFAWLVHTFAAPLSVDSVQNKAIFSRRALALNGQHNEDRHAFIAPSASRDLRPSFESRSR